MLSPLLALAVIALQGQSVGPTSLYAEDAQVSLTGQIRLLHGYGPPGWGETPKQDKHIVYWVIDLPNAISTPCKPERPEWAAQDCQSAKRLRLVIESDEHLVVQAKAAQGRRATVTGILRRQDTAGEMTPLFVEAANIKLSQ